MGKTTAEEERRYGSVRISAKLAKNVEEAIRELDLGYTDLTSFDWMR